MNFKPVKKVDTDFVPVRKVEEQIPDDWPSVAREALRNIPRSAVEFGKDVVTPFVHPVETAKSLGNVVMGAIEKIPGGKYLTPGPDYTQLTELDKREQAVDALLNFYNERYGSIKGFKQAVAKDPVGVIADAATVITAAGGVTSTVLPKTGRTMTKAGAMMEPLNVATLPLRASKKFIPKTLPSKLYEQAVKFSTTLSRDERSRITRTALEHRILPTYKGLDRIHSRINVLNETIDTLINQATVSNAKIPVVTLFQEFTQLKKDALLFGEPLKAQKAINRIRNQIVMANEKIGRKFLTPKQAQELKQNIYRDIGGYYAEFTNSPASIMAQKSVARAAKESLEQLIPEIKQLNKTEGDLLALRKEIERAASRIANRDILSMGTTVRAAGGGAVAGAPGLAAGLALGLLDSQPRIKARLALLLQTMRDRGISVRMTPTLSRLITSKMGQISEIEQSLEAK